MQRTETKLSRRPSWVVLVSLLVLFATGAVMAEEESSGSSWPRWRGSDFNGTSRESNIFPPEGFALEVRWRQSLGSGYSGVVVSDSHAVTMFSDGDIDYVASLDADDGREHWRLPIAPTYPGREGANDGPVSTPTIADGLVIALGPRGELVAIELDSGKTRWKRHLVDELGATRPHWGFSTSPLVVDERVFVETGGRDGALTAFDAHTGATLWSAGADEINYQSPILWTRPGGRELVAAGDETLFAVDPDSGRELWRYEHGGSGFYQRIVNPVIVGSDGIFFTHSPDGSKLVGLSPTENGGIEVQERWASPHLKLNYATPIVHEGHIYGFSRNFLSSIDADTGALNWKSRPPGNGFHILVDDHLVILTKQGSLHVAQADPEAYRELARLDVVSRITWTPPSFAGGRIYVRDSFADIVAVDVVTEIGSSTDAGNDPGDGDGLLPGTRFAKWIESLEGAPDEQVKQERVTDYVDEQPRIPMIEDDRFAHFIYRAGASDVALHGGMLGAKKELSMQHVAGTDLFYASFELAPDARIQYQFVRDLGVPETDPRNPRVSDSLLYPGKVSLLVMPEAEAPPVLADDTNAKGTLEELPFETSTVQVGRLTWGGERPVAVYLPEGYDPSSLTTYPSVYVLYGSTLR